MPLLEGLHLLGLKGSGATHHFVEIDLMTIEFGTIDTNELGLTAYADATGTTHACPINHDGVQRNVGGDVVFLGQQTTELHHDGRADGKHLIDVFPLDDLLYADGHHALLPIAAVIGHDDDLVARLTDIVLQNNQVFRPPCKHRYHAVAGSL